MTNGKFEEIKDACKSNLYTWGEFRVADIMALINTVEQYEEELRGVKQ